MKYKVLKEMVAMDTYYKPGDIYEAERYMEESFIDLFTKTSLQYGFIEEIKDEPWKPKEGEKHWTVYGDGDVGFSFWHEHDVVNQKRLDIGNCFQTKEQAEKAVEWLKAFKVLRDDTKGFKPDWKDKEQGEWCVYYDSETGKLDTDCPTPWKSELIHFATEADAKESIKAHRSEWLRFLNIEEENETSNGK